MDNKNSSRIERIGKEFLDKVRSVQKERVLRGTDEKKKSIAVLTNLMVKHNSFNIILEDILNYQFKEVKQ